MAREGRRGWVAAEDPAGDWWVLHVFEDGWVEVPGGARDIADTRANLAYLLPRIVGLVALVAATVVAGRLDVPVLPQLLGIAFLVLLLTSYRQTRRFRGRDHEQQMDDQAQDAAHGHRVRVREGRTSWRRYRTSAEFVAAVEGVRRVGSESVSRVQVDTPVDDAAPVIVSVWLHDGTWSGYRTPDRTAVRLFAPWSLGPVPG